MRRPLDPSDIRYPRRWEYCVIGREPRAVRAAIQQVAAGEEFELESSKRSAAGRYHSYRLELEVRDAAHRDRIFAELRAHAAVVYVL